MINALYSDNLRRSLVLRDSFESSLIPRLLIHPPVIEDALTPGRVYTVITVYLLLEKLHVSAARDLPVLEPRTTQTRTGMATGTASHCNCTHTRGGQEAMVRHG